MSDVPNINAFLHYYTAAPPPNLPQAAKEKYAAKRAFYACATTNGYDYLNYTNTGSKNKQDYVEYSGNNEKSTGAFSTGGLLTVKEKKALKRKLRETQSVIWDLVVSCEENFGKTYCNDFEQAYNAVKGVLPRFFKRAGFNPDNVEWYAGLHQNTDNRHLHICFWEKEPKRKRQTKSGLHFSEGYIPVQCVNYLKAAMELKFTDATAEIRALRKELTDSFTLGGTSLQNQLRKILRELPKTGRIGYSSENMAPLREQIDKATNAVFHSNPQMLAAFNSFTSAVAAKDIKTREILMRSKIPQSEQGRYMTTDKYLSDLYRRLGNQIINSALAYRAGETTARGRKARKRIERAREERLLAYSHRLAAELQIEAVKAFNEYMRELENERDFSNEK